MSRVVIPTRPPPRWDPVSRHERRATASPDDHQRQWTNESLSPNVTKRRSGIRADRSHWALEGLMECAVGEDVAAESAFCRRPELVVAPVGAAGVFPELAG